MGTYIRYCYTDEVIHNEISRMRSRLSDIVNSKHYNDSTFETIVYILERIMFIQDYYREMENENKQSKLREYPHYTKVNGTIQEVTGIELKKTYKNEIENNKKFMDYLNNQSRKHIAEILKNIHINLNLNSNNIWEGLKINSKNFLWKSNKRASDNKADCVRYFVNVIKHCYGVSIITDADANTLVNTRINIMDIARITLKAIDDYYENNNIQ